MALSSSVLQGLVNSELSQYYIEIPQYDENGNALSDKKYYIFNESNQQLKKDGSVIGDNVLKVLVDTICEKVIQHIITSAVVNSNVIVTSVSGVTTGPSVSGPGTGTASGTIS